MTASAAMHPDVEPMIGYTDSEDEIAIPCYENIPVRR